MNFKIKFTKQALKDLQILKTSNLFTKAKQILFQLEQDPFCLPYEKLTNELENIYSRRINIKHRIVYEVRKQDKVIAILRMWTHYGDN